MVQNNKVLTVSYGTFSCTLEGFDDSFETMKAIAEYFRDLAADDRYFGSEPPQPDAEMLTRIAQRDIARKVEASQSDNGLLLRASETAAVATPQVAPAPTAPLPTPPVAHAPEVMTPNTETAAPSTESTAQDPAADSIAAKLQRIRAVVSHSGEQQTQYSEDEEQSYLAAQPKTDAISAAFEAGALDPSDLEQSPLSADAHDEIADMPQTDATPFVAESEPEPAIEPVQDEAPADMMQEDVSAEPIAEEPQETAEERDPLVVAALDTTDEAIVEDIETDVEEPSSEVTNEDVLFDDAQDAVETEITTDEILNILNVDENEATFDDLEFEADETDTTAQGVLTVEDEAKLLDEIALVESELASHLDAESEAKDSLDQDVSRLMDSAGERMDDPATTNQRETYSHLRTAVAATEAEKAAKASDHTEETDQDYRGDLASVVSPRRPDVQVTSLRPDANTASPLKLVAEQRIDAEVQDTGPVMPRRVTSDQEAGTDEESGFAHFAQEQGAQSLPDLLEAAAAYLSFIEGQEQFSRPQLMNKVRSLKQDDFNREESLRSFGQLLRDGKIEKAGGGRFAASTQIGFRPNDERAAG